MIDDLLLAGDLDSGAHCFWTQISLPPSDLYSEKWGKQNITLGLVFLRSSVCHVQGNPAIQQSEKLPGGSFSSKILINYPQTQQRPYSIQDVWIYRYPRYDFITTSSDGPSLSRNELQWGDGHVLRFSENSGLHLWLHLILETYFYESCSLWWKPNDLRGAGDLGSHPPGACLIMSTLSSFTVNREVKIRTLKYFENLEKCCPSSYTCIYAVPRWCPSSRLQSQFHMKPH